MQQPTVQDEPDALPASVALVDNDAVFAEQLARTLRSQGVQAEVFSDSTDLITHEDPYGFPFYVLDLVLPGIDGGELIKVLRRRTDAGVLVLSSQLGGDSFRRSIIAGADMYLPKPTAPDEVALAIMAVQRRIRSANKAHTVWRLDRRSRQLLAPDGAQIELSDADMTVMECFLAAEGEVVSRSALRQQLGHEDGPDDSLNATIYRLRRRIERTTPVLVPLQSRSRVGYVFKAPLKSA